VNESVISALGTVVRRLRLQQGLTQEQLSVHAGLPRNYISSIELGEKHASISTVFRLALGLKIKPGKLVALVEQEIETPET
jgi:transcriptional regulator with XRE-family HTH domain